MRRIAMPARLTQERYQLPALITIALAGAAVGFGVSSLDGFARKAYALFGASSRNGLAGKAYAVKASDLTQDQLRRDAFTYSGDAFKHSGEFRMWLFLIVVQTALWAVAAAVLLSPQMRRPLREVWSRAHAPVVASVSTAGIPLAAVVIFASVHSEIHYPLPWHSWKVLALSLIGIGVALIGIAELAAIKFALENDPPVAGNSADIERYLRLRTLLQRILGIEGAIIGAAVLATGGLRNAVVAYDGLVANYGITNSPFPREYVLIYGAFFTLMLALLYAPVYFKLLEVGRKNVNAACPAEDPTSPAWLPAYEKRQRLEEHLQLGVATSASFRAGVAILTPLASALVALLLGAA
jgi:hypothetical protein